MLQPKKQQATAKTTEASASQKSKAHRPKAYQRRGLRSRLVIAYQQWRPRIRHHMHHHTFRPILHHHNTVAEPPTDQATTLLHIQVTYPTARPQPSPPYHSSPKSPLAKHLLSYQDSVVACLTRGPAACRRLQDFQDVARAVLVGI